MGNHQPPSALEGLGSMVTSLLAAAVMGQAAAQPTDLSRVFTKGETFRYQVRTELIIERKFPAFGEQTAVPESQGLEFTSSLEIKEVKGGGFATAIYRRPFMTLVLGETAAEPERRQRINTNFNLQMDISPINEVTALKDLNPPARPARPGGGSMNQLNVMMPQEDPRASIGAFVEQFAGALYQFAFGVSSIDDGIDLSPKLPYEPVVVGEMWKRTVGFAPQRSGTGGRVENRRFDIEFTYAGPVQRNGRTMLLVNGLLKVDGDVAGFINQDAGRGAADTGIREFALKMEAKIAFYLEPKTRHTVEADVTTQGSMRLVVTQTATPLMEEKFSGSLRMRRLANPTPSGRRGN